ncbi:MAG: hypothetical protein N2038_04700 [Geminicoccaceae bacterium]|nr:hypothetical protein [Geminicoccaceae bacterium]MCS7268475.1 hypothetical protein [Geminicoccaceae bacterium]MCX7629532.1 hypothetical protein [Geminicoccaceae bacterium]MDW8340863.1 hypothetical protein [Geminicoccaceae bacterium]
MSRRVRSRTTIPAGPFLAAVLLAGCSEALLEPPRTEASEHWSGRAEAVPGAGDRCGALAFELFRIGNAVAGRAVPVETAPEDAFPGAGVWSVEGTVNPNGTFLFALRESGWAPRETPRPFSVWRGSLGANEAQAVEQPPSCGRRVQFVRKTRAPSAS